METLDILTSTVAEIVATDYRTAEIFKKYGIDFCCGGKKTISNVCAEKSVPVDNLLEEIGDVLNSNSPTGQNFREWEVGFLIDYIVNVHHAYVKKNMPLITGFAEKVVKVHGEHQPHLKEVLKLWNEIVSDFTVHMQKEELMLFPFIKKLRSTLDKTESFTPPAFGTVKNPILMMEKEHDIAGELMGKIKAYTNNYIAPAHACNTYLVLFAKLREFEEDLHVHVHLENNILFPKAEQFEKEILQEAPSCSLKF